MADPWEPYEPWRAWQGSVAPAELEKFRRDLEHSLNSPVRYRLPSGRLTRRVPLPLRARLRLSARMMVNRWVVWRYRPRKVHDR
jgi:hypothetical protein